MGTINDRIIIQMKRLGLTDEELAEKTGIGLTAVKRFITGYSAPTDGEAAKLGMILGVPTDYLKGKTDVPQMSEPMERIPVFLEYPENNGNIEDFMPMGYIFGNYAVSDTKNCFFVVVDNDDMSAAKITSGDKVLIDPGKAVVSGDLAAVRINGEKPVIRRVFFDGPSVLLNTEGMRPESVEYNTEKTDIEFLGAVVLAISYPL